MNVQPAGTDQGGSKLLIAFLVTAACVVIVPVVMGFQRFPSQDIVGTIACIGIVATWSLAIALPLLRCAFEGRLRYRLRTALLCFALLGMILALWNWVQSPTSLYLFYMLLSGLTSVFWCRCLCRGISGGRVSILGAVVGFISTVFYSLIINLVGIVNTFGGFRTSVIDDFLASLAFVFYGSVVVVWPLPGILIAGALGGLLGCRYQQKGRCSNQK